MGSSSSAAHPVLVVGGSLAGLAAAARLAKLGHSVELYEATDRLGGGWAPYPYQGVTVDAVPGVLNFPAPWRDLFRKSGRPLEAELARSGLALEPAPPARYVFSDGSTLILPSDRGGQYEALTAAYGRPVAERWRDLVDELDQVWQTVRQLGLEAEFHGRAQLKAARALLRPRQTITDLAARLQHPQLAAIVTSVAYRLGSSPDRTPGWCAVDLSVQRTFGRWAVVTQGAPEQVQRSSLLVDALVARLALRKVTVHLNSPVARVTAANGLVSGVVTVDGTQVPAAAVVVTVNPWQTYRELWPTALPRPLRRAARRWQPAGSPTVTHRLSADSMAGVTETVDLSAAGVPRVTYTRPTQGGSLCSVHDYTQPTQDPSAGLAWTGFRSLLDRPPVTTPVGGLLLASPASPGGASPSAVVLSGALAAYGVQEHLG